QLRDVVALRRRVLRVAADVEVEAGAVAQEDVAAAPPRDDLAEQVAGHLVGAEAALAPERARHPVLVLDPEDPTVHDHTLGPRSQRVPHVTVPTGAACHSGGVRRTGRLTALLLSSLLAAGCSAPEREPEPGPTRSVGTGTA